MSLFDSILQNIGGAPDNISGLAERVGIDPAMAERAMAALGQTHAEEGDTVELASERTGLDSDVLNRIVSQVGGEGALSNFTGMLDKDGDGNALDDIGDTVKGLFNR